MDRELLDRFFRARLEEAAAPGEPGILAAPLMRHLVDRLSDYPAVVLSGVGEVLAQTRPAIALFGDYTPFGGSSRSLVDRWLTDPAARERCLVEVGAGRHAHLRRYRHAELGTLELYRQLLMDPVDNQMLLVFTAAQGSPSAEKLRLLAAHSA